VTFLQISFVIITGEEFTEFVFVREEYEKNFENYCSSSWFPGPGNMGQNGLKPIPFMMLPTKKTK